MASLHSFVGFWALCFEATALSKCWCRTQQKGCYQHWERARGQGHQCLQNFQITMLKMFLAKSSGTIGVAHLKIPRISFLVSIWTLLNFIAQAVVSSDVVVNWFWLKDLYWAKTHFGFFKIFKTLKFSPISYFLKPVLHISFKIRQSMYVSRSLAQTHEKNRLPEAALVFYWWLLWFH